MFREESLRDVLGSILANSTTVAIVLGTANPDKTVLAPARAPGVFDLPVVGSFTDQHNGVVHL